MLNPLSTPIRAIRRESAAAAVIAVCALLLPGSTRVSGQSVVRLNEVLAHNISIQAGDGTTTDWIELFNPSAVALDLGDMSLSDDAASPRRFVFPARTMIPGGGYHVVSCDRGAPPSASNTGFGLKSSGGGVFFYDNTANGGGLIDAIAFGVQAADYSIGRVPDGSGTWGLNNPSPNAANSVTALGVSSALRINEWKANGPDYFELYNTGERPVALGGLFVTDTLSRPTRFPIPGLSFIGTGSEGAYALFYADSNPGLGPNHVGFNLNDDGEAVGLSTGAGFIDSIVFASQVMNPGSEGRLPDGSATIVRFTNSPSPGAYNRLLGLVTDIVINEILTHTDPPLEDAIEFYNVTDAAINLIGWTLTVHPARDVQFEGPEVYRIAHEMVVAPRGYAVLYQSQFGVGGMRFNSAHGGEVVLTQSDASGNPLAFVTQDLGPAQNSVSHGRYQTGDGGYDFVALSARTFGADQPRSEAEFRKGTGLPNAGPLVGPVVINEIMYHPPDLGTNDNQLDEFIELRNITLAKQPLFDPRYPNNRWRLRDAVDFSNFPANTYIAPRGAILIVSFDPKTNLAQLAEFRGKYDVPASVPIYGPFTGGLNNGSDSVELVKPDPVQGPQHPDFGFVPYILADKVRYKDSAPWPAEADGTGLSVQRKSPHRYGNDVINWKAAAPSAGLPNSQAPIITVQPQNQSLIPGYAVTFSVVAAGSAPLTYQWRRNGIDIPGATEPSLTLSDPQAADAGNYSVLVRNDEDQAVSADSVLRVDTVKPVLTILTPRSGTRVSNDVVTVQGTARDDFGVARVLLSVNGTPFEPASGTTNWIGQVPLEPGTNVIQAKALDLGLNASSTGTVRVIFVVVSPLTLHIDGAGSITPDLDGRSLELGKAYALTASPGPGYLFSHWSGDLTSPSPSLSFVMRSNLTLTANFVPNPFLALKGTYGGLFFEPAGARHESSGVLTLTLSQSGDYTASLQCGPKRYPLKGRFDSGGRATNRTMLNRSNTLLLELSVDVNPATTTITGRVLANDWISDLVAERAAFHAVANPCPFAGAYTVILPGSDDAGSGPAGHGFGTVKIDAGGVANFSGTLADGTKAVQRSFFSAKGNWPLYVSLYSGQGSLVGWITAADAIADDLHATVAWMKVPGPASKLYPAGFAINLTLTGSRYQRPSNAMDPLLALTNGNVVFGGGSLTGSFTNSILLTANSRIVNLSSNKLTLTITGPTGLFSGTVIVPGSGRLLPFKGALHQKGNFGAGFFLETGLSGRVELTD